MIEGKDFMPFSYELSVYKDYSPNNNSNTNSNTKEVNKNDKHEIDFKPFSKKKVTVPEHTDDTEKYLEIEKFGNTSSDAAANMFMFIAIALLVIGIMFFIRYIELLAGGCPITVFELFVGRCGKRI